MEARKLSTSSVRPFQLSLRIRHPSMDPIQISRELHLEADHSFKAGDPRQSRSGLAPAAVHCETYWLGTLNPATAPAEVSFSGQAGGDPVRKAAPALEAANRLDLALMWCSTRILRPHGTFLRRIRSDGGQVSLIVALTPAAHGFSLTPEVTRALGQLGIPVEFEFTNDWD